MGPAKNSLYFFFFLCVLLLQQTAFAQAKKYPLFEHFTQASCDQCAEQNPPFMDLYEQYATNAHHIAYHPSWPGTDPMYDENPEGNDEMEIFYNVTELPSMFVNGENYGATSNITSDILENLTLESSPVRILVTENTTGSTRHVHVKVETVGEVPAGSYKLKAAVAQHLVDFFSAPGTNGETDFPDVFYKSLTVSGGEPVTLAASGSYIEFDTAYSLAGIDDDEAYVIAWLQNDATKEILNSGASGDTYIEVVNTSADIFTTTSSMFDGNVINMGASDADLTITLNALHPTGWDASILYDGTSYGSSASVSSVASSETSLQIDVTTGETPGIGIYTITVENNDEPEWAPMILRYYTIHDVTDLIVNNIAPFGDGSASGTWNNETFYTDAFNSAGVTTYATLSDYAFNIGMQDDAFSEINSAYLNIGWTFPALGKTNFRDRVKSFLDNGGNVFIAGQDIGWEADDLMNAGSSDAMNFYNNYLHATYVGDDAASTELSAVTTDEWFGTTAPATLDNSYYPGNFYPELMEPFDTSAKSIYYYGSDADDVAGIRSETDTYKTVYLGFGLEQVAVDEIRNDILTFTYQYFKDEIDGTEFESAMQHLLGAASPNPASGYTTIEMKGITTEMTLQLSDITGKVVKTVSVPASTKHYMLDVCGLESGMYFYFLSNGAENTPAQKLNIINF